MLTVNDIRPPIRGVRDRAASAGLVSLKSRQSREAGLRCDVDAARRRAQGADQDEPVAARLRVDLRNSG
jgi:hypothetical protein